jgi:hypothetical protein
MDKRLKIGLLFMLTAVVIMPIAFIIKDGNAQLALVLVAFTMLLEIIGLVLVISNVFRNRKK